MPASCRIPVSGTIKIKLKGDQFILMTTNQTNYLTKKVFWGGIEDYEYPTVSVFLELIQDMNCFMDIGANIGYYSLMAARLNPRITVHAFEPLPSAFLFLQKNIELNQLNNITAYRLALSDRAGEAEFFATKMAKAMYLEHHISGTSNLARAKDSFSEAIKVNTQTLDSFVKDYSIRAVDLLKLDTEGTENLILNGGRELIAEKKPIIISEILPGKIENELDEFYRENNYLYYAAKPEGLIAVDSLSGYSNAKEDFFFIHRSQKSRLNPFIKD
ncbi:FkbM family methyltransferase [candidate division KSB1 bacterium]|nr:FkbM family methyltransferase [candidate division KSB1 bacterium]